MKRIYLDHAATTPLDPRVLEAMLPYLREHWGNPSSLYLEAQEARKGLDGARRTAAGILGCKPQEVIFTSGGSESDNLALRAAAYAGRRRGNHVITTAIEHHAVLHEAERLEQEGFRVTYLDVDAEGFIDIGELEAAVTDETTLVSVMYVNNEVGTIEPIAEAARAVKAKNPKAVFHTDAVQAAGTLDVEVDRLGVDMLSLAAHKFYGPKGAGALYVRSRTPFQPQQLGGSQEKDRRAGTENVAGAVGMAKALELAYDEFGGRNTHYRALRDRLLREIPRRVPLTHVTGPAPGSTRGPSILPRKDSGRTESKDGSGRSAGERLGGRSANNASFCFEYLEGEAILIALDLAGVAASSGSACTSGSLEPSHVLTAMGVPEALARGSLRLTVGHGNTTEDIEYVLDALPGIVERLRSLSPAWRGSHGAAPA